MVGLAGGLTLLLVVAAEAATHTAQVLAKRSRAAARADLTEGLLDIPEDDLWTSGDESGDDHRDLHEKKRCEDSRICQQGDHFDRIKPSKKNPWRELTAKELYDIEQAFMSDDSLKLTQKAVATVADSYVHSVDLAIPNKEEVLDYLDHGGKCPNRYARVVVYCGLHCGPDGEVIEYLAGPLPVTNHDFKITKHWFYQGPERKVPWNSRCSDNIEYTSVSQVLADKLTAKIPEFTQKAAGGVLLNLDNDTLSYNDGAPRGLDGSYRRTWLQMTVPFEGLYLVMPNFQALLDHSGPDDTKWDILKVYYNQITYNSAQEFVDAVKQGKVSFSPFYDTEDLDAATRWRERLPPQGPARKYEKRAPPRTADVDERRYVVDKKNKKVEWMGWDISLSFSREAGLSLYDVRFKGERVAYEIALQEALASYGGNDPFQASTVYLDRFWGLGEDATELFRGYDCPYASTSLDVDLYEKDVGSVHRKNVICVFEAETNLPASRHYQLGFQAYGSTRGVALTIRTIAAAFNYDYLFDYVFHLDGTIQILNGASGYLQATYYTEEAARFGTRVQEYTIGTVHAHIMHYKVDLDIAGTDNSFLVKEIKPTILSKDEAWNYWGKDIQSIEIAETVVEKEDKRLTNRHSEYLIINEDEKNSWGKPRGYAIYNPTTVAFINPDSFLIGKMAEWGKYHMGVTRQSDKELWSTTTYNQNLPSTPIIDWDGYFDNESIRKEDIVAWVSLGMQHIPRAEDVPNTPITTSTATVWLIPTNYKDEHDIRDLRNSFKIQNDRGERYFGPDAKCTLKKTKVKYNGTDAVYAPKGPGH